VEIIRRIRVRRLIRDLYRAVLGREPDPDGRKTYEGLIRRIGAERAVPRMLKAFRTSAEYDARSGALAVSYVNSEMAARGTELIDGGPVAHLTSLGSYCLPGNIMRNHGLRRYSLPFDWIFSSPQMIIDCLTDDFSVFLDRRYYRSISESRWNPGAEHELYLEKYGIPAVFAHRDPTREEDYLYLTRCVGRFRQLLHSRDPKLFLIMGRPNHDLPNGFPQVLEALARVTTSFVLLGIDVLDPTGDGQCALSQIAHIGAHSLYRYLPSSYHAEGAYFPDRIDDWNVLRLVYRYRLALKDSPSRDRVPRQQQPAPPLEEYDVERPPAEHAVQ
jgi:Putative papain-like cysteine peptidase (DUF1796)